MTMITSTTQVPAFQYQRLADRSPSNTEFAPQTDEASASGGTTTSDRLKNLLARLEELKARQANMSNHDYAMENFALKEKISTERLNLGETLDTFAVEFRGRVFNLAGHVSGPGALEFAKLSDADGFELAQLRGGSDAASPEQRLVGVDIKV